jgi:glycosyltransferase involved in cell wall biosynthesis
VKGLLRAAKALADQRQDWQLVLVGTGVDYKEVRAYADELKFPEGLLRWTGELAPRQVADELAQADVFVLPSNYENAPVVISESLAEGVPVISTRAGGIPEMISSECGILVPPRDDHALTEAMATMLDHCSEYNRDTIRKAGLQYSYAKVGTELKQTYCQALMVRNAK